MMIADMLQVKRLERQLGRRLNEREIRGEVWVRLPGYGDVKVKQVSLKWLHNKNNCK